MRIQINRNRDKIPASEIGTGSLFQSEEGDLCLRAFGGAIRFDGDTIIAYTNGELDDIQDFQSCSKVLGRVSITIDLE